MEGEGVLDGEEIEDPAEVRTIITTRTNLIKSEMLILDSNTYSKLFYLLFNIFFCIFFGIFFIFFISLIKWYNFLPRQGRTVVTLEVEEIEEDHVVVVVTVVVVEASTGVVAEVDLLALSLASGPIPPTIEVKMPRLFVPESL